MDSHLPSDFRSATEGARVRPRGKRHRLRLKAGNDEIDVVEIWQGGFSIKADAPCFRRGFVDLYDGGKHLFHALAYPTSEDSALRTFAFKIRQDPDAAPPRDYDRAADVPVALIPARF